MTIEGSKLHNNPATSSLDWCLQGEQAAELYVAEIGCRMDALDRQVGLLKTALDERKRLLHEIKSG